MGYYMQVNDTNVHIKRENFPAALYALKTLVSPPKEPAYTLSWVDRDEVLRAETLSQALEAVRWEPVHDQDDPERDVLYLLFRGEKLGEDREVMEAIAEWVEHGGYIECVGEDNNLWRWAFVFGELREVHPEIRWPYLDNLPVQELLRAAEQDFNNTNNTQNGA